MKANNNRAKIITTIWEKLELQNMAAKNKK